MMTCLRPKTAALAAIVAAALGARPCCLADDSDTGHKLTLADLPGYRAALEGKPTAAGARTFDAPVHVRFRDLWYEASTLLGRRVTVNGRVERVFRQAAVGSFPPLAEVWITSPAGDPFCLVFAQQEPAVAGDERDMTNQRGREPRGLNQANRPRPAPEVGHTVRFTGTFLKMVSYATSDGKRLAPLIVGDRPPLEEVDRTAENGAASPRERSAEILRRIGGHDSRPGDDHAPVLGASLILALVMGTVAAGIITWQHLRTPSRRHTSVRKRQDLAKLDDPPLEFIN